MTLIEGLLDQAVKPDPVNDLPMYGSEQIYADRPIRFATVTLSLEPTDVLVAIAESIRREQDYPDRENISYRFYYCIEDINGGTGNGSITVITEDNNGLGETFYIDITPEDVPSVYRRIDRMCRERTGKSVRKLLDLSKQIMEASFGAEEPAFL